MTTAEIRGQVLRASLYAYERLKGPDELKAMVQRLPAEVAALTGEGALFTSSWYPIRYWAELHNAMRAQSGPGISVEVGRVGAEYELNTAMKFAMRAMSVKMILSGYRLLMRQYCRNCFTDLVYVPETNNHVRIRHHEFEGANVGVREEIQASVVRILELCGARSVHAGLLPGADESFTVDLAWR